MRRRRNPDKRWSYQDISTREIRILEGKKIETPQVSKLWEDLVRPLAETRGGDRAIIGISVVGKSEILRSRESGYPKSQNSKIRYGPSIRLGYVAKI